MTQKITFLFSLILISLTSFSQVRNYDDIGILLAQETIQGTARYTAMSGAFGALGGNLSAAGINPAGLAVFNQSEIAFTLGNKKNKTNVEYSNTETINSNNTFGLQQGGAVLVFETNNKHWSKFAFGINFKKANLFDHKYLIKGNNTISNESYFLDPVAGIDLYDNVTAQKMLNNTVGDNTKTSFTFSGQYLKNTYFGVSVTTNSISYDQTVNINEQSSDINNNTFNANQVENLKVDGEGISLNFGIITKPFRNLRLGLSYQTPTWYTLTEEYTKDTDIILSNDTDVIETTESVFEYEIKAPSKITGSMAYVFGKKGLISLDYNYKDFSKIEVSPTSEFTAENDNLKTNLKGVSAFRLGGEYRIEKLSFRGGYHFEESIYKDVLNPNTGSSQGFSLGFGVKILNKTTLDFSYNNTTSKDSYRYLNAVNPALLSLNDHSINATLTFNL